MTVLDTCIFDMTFGTVTLLWRGTVEIGDSHFEEIRHLLAVEEPVDAPRPAEDYAAVLADKLVDKDAVAARALAEDNEKKMTAIDEEARANVLNTLKEGGAPPELVAEVEKQKTIDDAQSVMLAWVQKMSDDLGLPKG